MKKTLLLLFAVTLCSLSAFAQKDTTELRSFENDKYEAGLYFKNGKLNFKTKDGAFKLMFDNRVYVDGAVYMPVGDYSGIEADPNDDIANLGYGGAEDDGQFRFNNGVIIRRARFGVKATLYDHWFAELDLDFAYNEIEMKDMFIGYKFNKHVWIKAGNFKEPMSIERLTSSKYLTGMERPMAVQTFAGGRKLGIAATGWGNHWWVSGGVFGAEASILQKERNRGSDGWGVSGRAAWSPIVSKDLVLHIGGYAAYRTPEGWGQENRWVYFRTFPESRVDSRRFVRAKIGKDGEGGYVQSYTTFGGELAFKYRKFIAYGEYIYRGVQRYGLGRDDERISLKDANLGGWYTTLSYMILGEQRQYAQDDAEFGPMNVRKKGGNLELVGRVSTIDMNEGNEALYPIMGGSAIIYSSAINWFPVPNILIGLNYQYVNNDKYADDKGDLTYNGKPLYECPEFQNGIDYHSVQMRLLVSF